MVNIAQNMGNTDDENANLVEDIAIWLQARTTTVPNEYGKLFNKYITKPVQKLQQMSKTEDGANRATRKIRYWLASDTHPEYSEGETKTMGLLFAMIRSNINEVIKEIKGSQLG